MPLVARGPVPFRFHSSKTPVRVSLGVLVYRTVLLTLLSLGIAANKVVKAIGARLGAEHGEGQVVVLEIETNAWKVDNGLNADGPQLLGVTWD